MIANDSNEAKTELQVEDIHAIGGKSEAACARLEEEEAKKKGWCPGSQARYLTCHGTIPSFEEKKII